MKRTKSSSGEKNVHKTQYPIQDEPIVLSKPLLDLLLEEDQPANVLALYAFYYYTAKWQRTNQIRATTAYVAKGLKWGEVKVKAIKKRLKELGLITSVVRHGPSNTGIIGHYIRIKFIWSRSAIEDAVSKSKISQESRNHTPTYTRSSMVSQQQRNHTGNALSNNTNKNALSANKLVVKNQPTRQKVFDTFITRFPLTWQQDAKFQEALRDWCIHRKQQHIKLTPKAMSRQSNKLKRECQDVEEATYWITHAIEKSWTGIFRPGKNVQDVDPIPNILPEELFEQKFDGSAEEWIEDCLNPALALMPQSSNGDAVAVARGMCSISAWYVSHQEDPKFDSVPKIHDPMYGVYCRWQNVPGPKDIIERYVAWLRDQQWLQNFSPRQFTPDSGVFRRFLQEYQNKEGYDFFTGDDISR
jgi:hypothetical protein